MKSPTIRRVIVLSALFVVVAGALACTRRVSLGSIAFENFTGHFVDCYLNGQYQATAVPFGSVVIDVRPGTYEIFAESPFRQWGPDLVTVPAGLEFVYELFP